MWFTGQTFTSVTAQWTVTCAICARNWHRQDVMMRLKRFTALASGWVHAATRSKKMAPVVDPCFGRYSCGGFGLAFVGHRLFPVGWQCAGLGRNQLVVRLACSDINRDTCIPFVAVGAATGPIADPLRPCDGARFQRHATNSFRHARTIRIGRGRHHNGRNPARTRSRDPDLCRPCNARVEIRLQISQRPPPAWKAC